MGDKTMLELLSPEWNGGTKLIYILHTLNASHLFLLSNCNFVPGDQNTSVHFTMQPLFTAISMLM